MGVKVVFLCCLMAWSISSFPADAQFNVDPAMGDNTIAEILGSMTNFDKIKFMADFLYKRPELFQQLEDTLLAAFPILNFDPPEKGLFTNLVLPWALDQLPKILKNHEFLGIMEIFIHKINAVNITQNFYLKPPPGFNVTHAMSRAYFMLHLLQSLDLAEMLQEVLMITSVRDIVPFNSTDHPLSEQCYDDTMNFLDNLLMGATWALDMIDAVGKPTTGIRRGVLHFIGTYDQCAATHARLPKNSSLPGGYRTQEATDFKGRYCRSTFNLPSWLVQSVAGEHINNTYGIPMTLTLGMCLPDSCHGNDIDGLLHLGFLGSWFNLSVANAVCTEEKDFPDDKPAQTIIGILGGLILLVLCASVIEFLFIGKPDMDTGKYVFTSSEYENHGYEMEERPKPVGNGVDKQDINHAYETSPAENGSIAPETKDGTKDGTKSVGSAEIGVEEGNFTQLVRSFSVFTNIPALASTTTTKEEDIPSLYGLRFFSMLWIMLGNTFLYAALSLADGPVAVNLMDSYDIMERFTFQAVMGATFATDTFFVISGCLAAYWYLTRVNRESRSANLKTWVKFYLGRYWKFTPPYMLVLATFSILYMYLGHGPLWPKNIAVADSCSTDWWKHLVYINNLVGIQGVEPDKQCMPWSWYLAVQMQFYLISPILLTFIAFSVSMGTTLTLILAVAGIVAAGLKENAYGGNIMTSKEDHGDYWNNVFIAPWCRVATYCIGIILGVVLQAYFHKRIHKALALLGWVLCACVGVLLVYCTYTKYTEGDWTRAQEAAYEALGRPAWALCVAWVIYACSTERGGPLSDFLSWKGFVPLSRLTFMVFLLHPVLMVLVVYSKRSLIYLNDFEMSYLFIGHVVVSYLAAFAASLVIDAPFRNMKRLVSGKRIGHL